MMSAIVVGAILGIALGSWHCKRTTGKGLVKYFYDCFTTVESPLNWRGVFLYGIIQWVVGIGAIIALMAFLRSCGL